MMGQVMHVSTCLVTLLELGLDKDAQSRTPSPSVSGSAESEDSNSMDGATAVTRGLATFDRKSSPVIQLPLDPSTKRVSELCLQCLAHIFTWAGTVCVSSRLINILFQYAALEYKSQVIFMIFV